MPSISRKLTVPSKKVVRKFELSSNQLLYQEVIKSIFRALVEGHIKPGERLVEAEIAQELSVSRSPVRQALQEMARQGIVVLIPRIGASVATWTPKDIEDFCRLRVLIEGLAAEQAASRIEEAELQGLCGWTEAMRSALTRQNLEDLIESDIAFHRLVVQASHNASLLQTYEAMVLRIRMFMIVEKHVYPSHAGHEISLATHQSIYGALKNKDAKARALMEQHITDSAAGLISRMKTDNGALGRSDLPSIVESILQSTDIHNPDQDPIIGG